MAVDRFAENVWPIDGVLTYMTPASGFGQRLRLETIDKTLARLPLGDVLLTCAVVAHLADQSMTDRDGRFALARGFLPLDVVDRAQSSMERDRTLASLSSQQALTVALRALTACSDAAPAGASPLLDRRLGGLMLAVGDHLSYRTDDKSTLLLDLVRAGLFYRLNGILEWYSTAEALFFRTMPSLIGHPQYVDAARVVEELAGFPLDVFWALNACYGFYVFNSDRLQRFPFPLDEAASTDRKLVDRWLELNVLPTALGRNSAAEDLARRAPWSFTTFLKRPLVEVAPGTYFPIRTQLLAQKATTAGMFYFIFDLLKEAGEDHQRWANFMGSAVEAHGQQILQEFASSSAVLSFPEKERTGNPARWPKACDAMLAIGDDVVVIDFVHRNLSLPTQATGGYEDLELDLRRAVQEKVGQLDATLERRLASGGPIHRLYPVIVTGAPLPLNPAVRQEIDRLVQELQPKVIGIDQRCRQLGILELYELKMLLQTAAANDMTVTDLLERWYSVPLRSNNLRDWIVQTSLSVTAVGPGDEWEKRAFAILR